MVLEDDCSMTTKEGEFMGSDTAKFKNGQVVWHKAGSERGVVCGILFGDDGVSYRVSWDGRIPEFHGACELSKIEIPDLRKTEDDDD